MTIVKVLLLKGCPDFILIHVDEIHSKTVTGVAHGLKVHYNVALLAKCP